MGGRPAATPIIMFSANVTPEAREECLSAGANAFVPKPIQVDSFLSTLEELAGLHHATPKGSLLVPAALSDTDEQLSARAEPVLDLHILRGLESVSKDPAFLGELITEYQVDSRYLLQRLAQGIEDEADHEIKEVLHALRGSALSIGATSMKMICKRFERLAPARMKEKKEEILRELYQAFMKLCRELEIYQHQRLPAEQAPPRPE
jgi:two-component system sensor histidine kinase RpfC